MSWLLGLALWLGVTGIPQAGIVKHYDRQIFAHVARVRHMPLSAGVAGYAAVENCAYVQPRAPWVVVARIDGGPAARYEVLDCVAPRDVARHRAEGLVLEVDFATATHHPQLLRTGRAPGQVLGYARLEAP